MNSLEQVQNLVNQLDLLDQVRLLEYLAPRILNGIQTTTSKKDANAWQEFFQIGDTISASDVPETKTLTEALAMMRR